MSTNVSQQGNVDEKLEEGRQILERFGLNLERLAVLAVGGEQIVGEVRNTDYLEDGPSLVGVPVLVKNPKRIIRLQKMDQRSGAITIEFLLGDYDYIEAGLVQVQSHFAYWVKDISPASQLGLLSLFVEFVKRHSARSAGLVLPESGLVAPDGRSR